MATITRDEWLAEIDRIQQASPTGEGMTTEEIADALGRSIRYTSALLKKIHRAGRLQCTRAHRETRDLRQGLVPVYTIKP